MTNKLDFLIIGNFRSGTSFLSNVINSHPKGYCVYDPYIYLIKIYDGFVKNKKFDENKDLDHFIKLKKVKNQKWINYLSKLKFSENINFKQKILFKKLLLKYKLYQHPKIINLKISKKKQSYKEFFLDTLNQFQKFNSKKRGIKIGTKVSWCEEYLPVFFNSFENLKIIFIYRDIKSIISSGIKSEVHGELPLRPILYYIYYWKKSILFFQRYKKNIFSIKYENLISNFHNQKKRLYKFLDLKDRDIKSLKDQFDKKWTANSSYQIHNKSLIKDTRQYYKKRLSNDLIKTIDYLCQNELYYLGYSKKPIKNQSKKKIIKCLSKYDKKTAIKKKYHKFLNYNKCLQDFI